MNRLLILMSILAACGDNAKVKPDGGAGDDSGGGSADEAPLYKAVMVGADFSSGTGVLSRLDIATLSLQSNAVAGAATSDPVIRHVGDKLYVINRSVGENVTILDAKTLAPIDQISTGAGSNPQDVAVVGDKLYVPAMGTTGVVVLQGGHASTIDLGAIVGDPDGKPDCISAYAVGTKVFVACDQVDGSFVPRGVGKIVVIDTTNDHATVLSLPDKNPQGFFIQTPDTSAFHGDLLIATVPSFDTYTQGCLVRVPVDGTTTPTCATGLTNAAVSGFFNTMAIGPDGKLYITVVVSQNYMTTSARLRTIDMTTGAMNATALSPTTELLTDLATCPDGSVVASDQTFGATGVRVFKNGAEVTTTPISIGLPPIFSGGLVCYDVNHP